MDICVGRSVPEIHITGRQDANQPGREQNPSVNVFRMFRALPSDSFLQRCSFLGGDGTGDLGKHGLGWLLKKEVEKDEEEEVAADEQQ